MANSKGDDDSLATVAKQAPVTARRKLRTDLEAHLTKPYLGRALAAPDADHPKGTEGHSHNNMTVLQQHVAFFDLDNNGIVYPWETYRGFRKIGFNALISLAAAFLINVFFSYTTLPSKIPSLLFPIYIERIHVNKHGSDTDVYDKEGRFVPANLENIFSKYARSKPDMLSLQEVWNMTEGNRNVLDFIGWVAAKLEWGLLYLLARDKNGYLSKETIRMCYDGSLFYCYAKKRNGHGE